MPLVSGGRLRPLTGDRFVRLLFLLCRCFSSEQCSELFDAHVDIFENLHEESDSYAFTGMGRYRRSSTICVTQVMMTTLNPNDLETSSPKSSENFTSLQSRNLGHRQTEMRCTPMNSGESTAFESTSKQRSTTSRTRLSRTSNDLAWVWQPRSSGTEAT